MYIMHNSIHFNLFPPFQPVEVIYSGSQGFIYEMMEELMAWL